MPPGVQLCDMLGAGAVFVCSSGFIRSLPWASILTPHLRFAAATMQSRLVCCAGAHRASPALDVGGNVNLQNEAHACWALLFRRGHGVCGHW